MENHLLLFILKFSHFLKNFEIIIFFWTLSLTTSPDINRVPPISLKFQSFRNLFALFRASVAPSKSPTFSRTILRSSQVS